MRKCAAHGNQAMKRRITRNLFPEQKLYLIAEGQTSLAGQRIANGKCPVLFICVLCVDILFQVQPQLAGRFTDHITVFICKSKLDKLIDIGSICLEPVFQLNVGIMHRVILQADLDFLKTKIFRHMVCRNCVKYRDITDTVKPVQIVFIDSPNPHGFVCCFVSVCILDVLVVGKVIPGVGCKTGGIGILLRPVNAAAAAEGNRSCQSGSVFKSGVAVEVVRIRNCNHVFSSGIMLFVRITLVQFRCLFFRIQYV